MGVWVNHGEGRCHFPDPAVFERVKRDQLVPMRYVNDLGEATETCFGSRTYETRGDFGGASVCDQEFLHVSCP